MKDLFINIILIVIGALLLILKFMALNITGPIGWIIAVLGFAMVVGGVLYQSKNDTKIHIDIFDDKY